MKKVKEQIKKKRDKKDKIILVLTLNIIALVFVFAVLPTIFDLIFGFNKPYCFKEYPAGDSVFWIEVLCEDLETEIYECRQNCWDKAMFTMGAGDFEDKLNKCENEVWASYENNGTIYYYDCRGKAIKYYNEVEGLVLINQNDN